MKKFKFFLHFILIFAIYLTACPAYSADESIAFKVKDISDRKYEQAVIQLLDNAEKSIVISMYSISLGTKANNPINLLLNDLLEARERGASVTLYLNTRVWDAGKAQRTFIESPIYNKLKDAGCIFYLIPSHRTLHDKLIIVDNRYVVEGSTNWSLSALKNNFEPATLIDSSGLAKVKLARLENLLAASEKRSGRSHTPVYLDNLPKTLTIPKELLLNKKYFSKMVSNSDRRSLDLYLLLLAHSQTTGKKEFFISLEALALSLAMPAPWTYTALRRQVIKVLKKLQHRYNLIETEFFYGRNAAVRFNPTVFASEVRNFTSNRASEAKQSQFDISTNLVIKTKDNQITMRLKYLLLVEALLKSEGKDLDSMSQPALAKRFNVHVATIHTALKDLRKHTE